MQKTKKDLVENIFENPEKVPLPDKMWNIFQEPTKIIFAHMAPNLQIDRCVTVDKRAVVPFKAAINGTNVKIGSPIRNMKDLVDYLQSMHISVVCPGSGVDNGRHKMCAQILTSYRRYRCTHCKTERKRALRQKKREDLQRLHKRRKQQAKSAKMHRLKKKVSSHNTQETRTTYT